MIPITVTFIYLYGPNTREFDINHYISIKSTAVINHLQPFIYTNDVDRLKTSHWIKRLISEVRLVIHNANPIFKSIENRYLRWSIKDKMPYMAHRADILRLYLMSQYGGVYSDVDSIALQPIPLNLKYGDSDIFWTERHDGEEANSLCNGFFIARPKSEFLENWIHYYRTYDAEECKPGTIGWTKYSVQLGWKLYTENEHTNNVIVLDSPTQIEPFYLTYKDVQSQFFLNRLNLIPEDSIAMHLWETRNRDILKVLDEDYFKESNATYAVIGNKWL